MNWIEEAIQPKPLPFRPPTQTTHFLRMPPAPVHLRNDAEGRVVFRVDYTSQGTIGAVVVRVRTSTGHMHPGSYMWSVAQRYEVGNPREHDMAMRAALVRMYTELFEDRCEQTGIPCVNERRKEMKRWLSVTTSPKE